MLVVAVLTIIAFAWLYNPAELNKLGSNHIATIYGKNLAQADIDREVRKYSLALSLGQIQLLADLGGAAQTEEESLESFVWNVQVLQHQAKLLGVEPTDKQVFDLIKSLPVFQTSGQFDPLKYGAFVQEKLGPKGFTEEQIEAIIRDSLRLERIKNVVSAPVAVNDAEVTEALRAYQKVDLQIARFALVDPSTVTVSEEELQKFFNDNKEALLSPETRSVKYVEFSLAPDQASLSGREKVEALNKLAESAAAFAEKATSASFDTSAQAAGYTVKSSPQFDRGGNAQLAVQLNQTPTDNADLPALAPTAFLLSDATKVSDVVQSGDKFFVLHLGEVVPQRPLTFEEVRAMVEPRLKVNKVAEATQQKAEQAILKIRDAVSAGRSFTEAAQAEGLTVDAVNGFEPAAQAQEMKVPIDVIRLSMLLEPAQMSGFVPSAEGGLAFFVAARAPIALAGDELTKQKETISQDILEGKRRILFNTWLSAARDQAKISMVSRNQ